MTQAATRRKSIISVLIVTVLVLSVPLVAMEFSDEVNWGLGDFIIIGALVFVTGLVYEFQVKHIRNTTHRVVAGIALAAVLFLIWAQLAIGLIEKLFTGR